MKEIMLRFLLFMVTFNGVMVGIHFMASQWHWVGLFAPMTLGFLYHFDEEPDAEAVRLEALTSRGAGLLLAISSAGIGVSMARMDALGLIGIFIHGSLAGYFTYRLFEMKYERE